MINSHQKLVLAVFWLYIFCTQTANACQYTVRETGFADLGTGHYSLYGFVDQNTPPAIVDSISNTCHQALLETNIDFKLINVDEHPAHAATQLLDSLTIESLPCAILVSPDGHFIEISTNHTLSTFAQELRKSLHSLLASPKRQELVENIIDHYGVILLIDGKDDAKNSEARETAEAAIKHIASKMELMPKPVEHPPVIVVLDKTTTQETVTLWSLGLKEKELVEPHAAILYGRVRWIGPLLRGDEITIGNLVELLLIIGMDCECGIDRRWIMGTMLPIRWSQKEETRVVENLGFNPENPMIKAEIRRILQASPSYYGSDNSKGELASNSKFADRSISLENFAKDYNLEVIADSTSLNSDGNVLNIMVIVTLVLVGLVLFGGSYVYWHSARRKNEK